ncbi:MAG: R3H domain-containing nucleic acid-binding protein [Acidimicrobiia bacterium]|nr:R3H domain-containing nucleic acid-binding protein [Acidimicrobiia bacterium]
MPIEEQVPIVEEFLSGLVDAFGLEGEVAVSIDDDVIVAEITGEQTESMVGNRGSVIEAIHELTKTVMHRKMQSAARLRLDIAGYAERRRRALRIYADQLVDQVLSEGGEIMLEPMSAADRKVIHDAVAARDGVRSYSEGEAPQRFVVIQNTDAGSSEEE